MYGKQVALFKWSYMIDDKENEAENRKNRYDMKSHRYDINRPRLSYKPKLKKCIAC